MGFWDEAIDVLFCDSERVSGNVGEVCDGLRASRLKFEIQCDSQDSTPGPDVGDGNGPLFTARDKSRDVMLSPNVSLGRSIQRSAPARFFTAFRMTGCYFQSEAYEILFFHPRDKNSRVDDKFSPVEFRASRDVFNGHISVLVNGFRIDTVATEMILLVGRERSRVFHHDIIADTYPLTLNAYRFERW